MKRIFCCIALLGLVVPLLTSCMGLRQINELAMVAAVGLDLGEKPGTVRLWQTKGWTGGATLTHPSEVLCVATSPDGRWVAAGGSGKTVSLWDVRPQK